ncbi:MAG: hypothetical protein ACRCXT_02025 [Paraclostridium sp.]
MEQMTIFVIGAIGTIVLGLITNSIYDKLKSHSSIDGRKSGYTFEFTLLSIKFKKK